VVHPYRLRMTVCGLCLIALFARAQAAIPDPVSPAAFLPGGMLGVQVGSPWASSKRSPAFGPLTCQSTRANAGVFDEVCFFKTSSRVAGADIHDGFIVRRGDRVVLIGTGIAIKNADDPLAESVMRDFESQVHAKFQHTGADVLFVNLPDTPMSAGELAGYSQTAPVLLVELEPKGNELAVLYGYLAPVNAFSAMASN
jgi:hypothetical protein